MILTIALVCVGVGAIGWAIVELLDAVVEHGLD